MLALVQSINMVPVSLMTYYQIFEYKFMSSLCPFTNAVNARVQHYSSGVSGILCENRFSSLDITLVAVRPCITTDNNAMNATIDHSSFPYGNGASFNAKAR